MPQLYSGPPSALRNLPKQAKITAELGVPWTGLNNTTDALDDFRSVSKPGAETLSPALILGNDPAQAGKPATPDQILAQAKIKRIQQNLQNPPFQTFGSYTDTHIKVPWQAWDFIAHGPNGIFYWLLQPEDSFHEKWSFYTIFVRPSLRGELKKTLGEMQTLWPRVMNSAQGAATHYESQFGNVFYRHRVQGKQVTVVAVNESEVDWHTVKTTIASLSAIPEVVAQVSNENRTVTIKNGVLEDTFRSNEAHVYLITLE